jgi:hypothetical protein
LYSVPCYSDSSAPQIAPSTWQSLVRTFQCNYKEREERCKQTSSLCNVLGDRDEDTVAPCLIHLAPPRLQYLPVSYKIAPKGMAAIVRAPATLCVFFALFVTFFVHNVSASISYDRKELLGIRTAITHLGLDKYFFFNESEVKYLQHQAQIPVIRMKKRHRHRVHRFGCLMRIHW